MDRRWLVKRFFLSVIGIVGFYSVKGSTKEVSDKITGKKNHVISLPFQPVVSMKISNGTVCIGKENSDPKHKENQVKVFCENEIGVLLPVDQPINLDGNGYLLHESKRVKLITNDIYSMGIYDGDDNRILYFPALSGVKSDSLAESLAYDSSSLDVTSFAELRNKKPSYEGASCVLKGWNKGSTIGGGVFVGAFGEGKDDGGIIASGDGFYWKRNSPTWDGLTIEHFGGIIDGFFDCHDAIIRMYEWSQDNDQTIGIKIPSGNCFTSPVDISSKPAVTFKLSGLGVSFGYFTATKIRSNGQDGFIFTVNSRYTEISGICVDGGREVENKKQGFFKNIIKGGQFLRVQCMQFKWLGGVGLDIIDTLDAKIDQWYASQCTASVIRNSWSDTIKGNWNHTTAIELSNFNCQSCIGGVLNIPRCFQSIIFNGWMERCDPGDISQGHWAIHNLSLEDCDKYGKLNAFNSRLTEINTNLVTSTIKRGVDSDSSFVGAYQLGQTHIEPYGVNVNGSLSAKYQTSQLQFKNSSKKNVWLDVGKFFIPLIGQQINIEVVAQSLFSPADKNSVNISDVNSGSRAFIRIQRTVNDSASASWHSEGSSPIHDVNIVIDGGGADIGLYLKLNSWVQAGSIFVKTNSVDNFYQSNNLFWFSVNMKISEKAPSKGVGAVRKISLHNGNGGIGVAHNGEFMLEGPDASSDWKISEEPLGYIQTYRNGTLVAIPYFGVTK